MKKIDGMEADVVEKMYSKKTDTGDSAINLTKQPAQRDTDEHIEDDDEKNTTINQHLKRETEELFSRLNLQYQRKLNPEKFLQVGPTLKHDKDVHESDLPFVYLNKILVLNHRARYVQAKKKHSDECSLKPLSDEEPVGDDDDDDDIFHFKTVDRVPKIESTDIHPLDIQMAVFHCSDGFLRQKMVTKLSQCQYALPLLVPDLVTNDIECPLWTFRQIRKTWKITETNGDSNVVTMKSISLCKAATPMVFIFRLGSLSVSKSELINSLINDRHHTFFHRKCPGSTKTRLLVDGVVEIAWYCPNGQPNDTFNDCVAFCNLHGDGLSHDKPLNILKNKSSVNVVLVPTLDRKHESAVLIRALSKSTTPLIVLIEDSDSIEKTKKGHYKVGLNNRNDVSEELKKIIRETLSGSPKLFQLETMAETGIKVDEDDTSCQKGWSAAKDIMNIIGKVKVSSIRSTYLPCQDQLWHDWCRVNKEQYNLRGHTENDKCDKKNEMQKLRKDQCFKSCSELMKSFIKHLTVLSTTEREYFLKWTQILLDDHAADYLSLTCQDYERTWSELLSLKKKHDKSDELKPKQAELAELSKNIQSATCGLQHIFREMGQIYEAHKSLEKPPDLNKTDWTKYPKLAAELMISGHPMELIDGDAGHVPLIWISSLIDEVINKLEDKKVFVFSVLGIQSSGKSTMLNAMFGLQFSVSAGRCTRGAFMQLVKLSEDIKKDYKWDYILVVDTEGLRAPALEGNTTIHHDNELATFVVGVGNMTLVNIFGETPSEIQDILQIVVQTFMRMKKVNLSPSCVFVHQNVTDVAAVEKNLEGKRHLQEKLDQMVYLAAKEEVWDANSFSDIIEFDVQKDVKYFAQLWEGSPPMAPPNPGYSECVQDLRSFILSKASKSPGVSLSEFKNKVQDLWYALINENFVFSFKNTLEIAIYRQLEVEFGNWTWALRSEMLNIENRLYTKIENGELDQVHKIYLYGEIRSKEDEITTAMSSYFDNNVDKEMLVQWRAQHELKMKDFLDELVRGLQRKLSDVIEQKKTSKKLDEMKAMFEDKLQQKSKELAQKLKDKANDEEELKKQFSCVWDGWINDLTQGTKPIEKINFGQELITVLYELGIDWTLISYSQSANNNKSLSELGDYTLYVGQKRHKHKEHYDTSKEEDERWRITKAWDYTKKKVIQFLTGRLPHEQQQQIREFIHRVETESLELIKTKPVATRGYSSTYLTEIGLKVITDVADFESTWKYSLKREFTNDLILYVFNKTENWILQSYAHFIKITDARTYLESKKEEYFSVFKSFYKGSSSAVVLAEIICEKLKVSMTEAVCNQTAIDIAVDMRCSAQAFSGNRCNLEKHVLKSLAEMKTFICYTEYIHNPKEYTEDFIKCEVRDLLNKDYKQKSQEFLIKNVNDINNYIKQALNDASVKTKFKSGDLNMWLQEFTGLIKNKLTFGQISFQNFSDVDVNRFDFLKEEIEKGLDLSVKDLKNLPLEKMESRQKPEQILIDHHCNCCWEKCPFCGAVCIHNIKDHRDYHSVPLHRSPSVNGVHYRGMKDMSLPFCTTQVASKGSFFPDDSEKTVAFKSYQTAGPKFEKWSIIPDQNKLSYWQWVVCTFEKHIEQYYGLEFKGKGKIPEEWRKITAEEAIKSLEEIYK